MLLTGKEFISDANKSDDSMAGNLGGNLGGDDPGLPFEGGAVSRVAARNRSNRQALDQSLSGLSASGANDGGLGDGGGALLWSTCLRAAVLCPDADGRTPIHVAAQSAQALILGALLGASAGKSLAEVRLAVKALDPEAQDGEAPLGSLGAGGLGGGFEGEGEDMDELLREEEEEEEEEAAEAASMAALAAGDFLGGGRAGGERRGGAAAAAADLADNRGEVALHLVRGAAACACLLRRGADPNPRNADGATPLHGAVRRGDSALVTALLLGGADAGLAERVGASQEAELVF